MSKINMFSISVHDVESNTVSITDYFGEDFFSFNEAFHHIENYLHYIDEGKEVSIDEFEVDISSIGDTVKSRMIFRYFINREGKITTYGAVNKDDTELHITQIFDLFTSQEIVNYPLVIGYDNKPHYLQGSSFNKFQEAVGFYIFNATFEDDVNIGNGDVDLNKVVSVDKVASFLVIKNKDVLKNIIDSLQKSLDSWNEYDEGKRNEVDEREDK